MDETSALVLFSGGQDSTTCLAWALDRFDRVETVGFDYRQRNRVELDVRPSLRAALAQAFPRWAASSARTTASTLRRSPRSPRAR